MCKERINNLINKSDKSNGKSIRYNKLNKKKGYYKAELLYMRLWRWLVEIEINLNTCNGYNSFKEGFNSFYRNKI